MYVLQWNDFSSKATWITVVIWSKNLDIAVVVMSFFICFIVMLLIQFLFQKMFPISKCIRFSYMYLILQWELLKWHKEMAWLSQILSERRYLSSVELDFWYAWVEQLRNQVLHKYFNQQCMQEIKVKPSVPPPPLPVGNNSNSWKTNTNGKLLCNFDIRFSNRLWLLSGPYALFRWHKISFRHSFIHSVMKKMLHFPGVNSKLYSFFVCSLSPFSLLQLSRSTFHYS